MSTVAVSTPASAPRSMSSRPRSAAPPAADGSTRARETVRGKPRRGASARATPGASVGGPKPKVDAKILFQSYFKSVGPRTYASQVKEAGNGNQFIVLTEGKRDDATGEVRKTRLFIFSEDFPAFFRLIKETAEWVKAHPVSDEVKEKRRRYWAKQRSEARDATREARGQSAAVARAR